MKERCNIPQPEFTSSVPVAVVRQPAPTFRRIESTIARLTELITACGDQQAVQRLRLLDSIVQRWEDGVHVQIRPSQDVLETTPADVDDLSDQADAAVIPTAGYPSRAVLVTTPAVGDSQDRTETAELPADSVQHAEGVTLKELHVRLPRVRGRGNVRRKKTVTFGKRPAGKENAHCPAMSSRKRRCAAVDDRCAECGLRDPPAHLDTSAHVDWIACDECSYWYHVCCVQQSVETKERFVCVRCVDDSR